MCNPLKIESLLTIYYPVEELISLAIGEAFYQCGLGLNPQYDVKFCDASYPCYFHRIRYFFFRTTQHSTLQDFIFYYCTAKVIHAFLRFAISLGGSLKLSFILHT